jgi:hypothetical protein
VAAASARVVVLLPEGAAAPAGAWGLQVADTLGEGPAAATVVALAGGADGPAGAVAAWPGEAIISTGPAVPGMAPAARAALFARLADPADAPAFEAWLRDGIARAEVVRLAGGGTDGYHYANLVDLSRADALHTGERPQSPIAQSTSFGHIGPPLA